MFYLCYRNELNTPWREWRRTIAISLLVLTFAACDKPAVPLLVEGQAFPSFMLDFVSRANPTAPSQQGKMLVLNVWATWCPPCRQEMPGLERLSKTLDPKRFVVIGVSIDDDAFLVAEFLEQYGITFTNILDQSGKRSRPLELQVYPETFVIAGDGTLVRRITGRRDWGNPDTVKMLEALYQEQLHKKR